MSLEDLSNEELQEILVKYYNCNGNTDKVKKQNEAFYNASRHSYGFKNIKAVENEIIKRIEEGEEHFDENDLNCFKNNFKYLYNYMKKIPNIAPNIIVEDEVVEIKKNIKNPIIINENEDHLEVDLEKLTKKQILTLLNNRQIPLKGLKTKKKADILMSIFSKHLRFSRKEIFDVLTEKQKKLLKKPLKIYCGIGTVPKGHKLGSMLECHNLGKINYWGLRKVDSKVLNSSNKKAKVDVSALRIEMAGLKGLMNKNKRLLERSELPEEKKKYKEEYDKALQSAIELQKKIDSLTK